MGARSGRLFIIQRVIPHYRIPLFEALHARFGVQVLAAAVPPGGTFLNLANPREHAFAIPVPIRFPDPANAFRADVPLDFILDTYKPRALVAEFGLRMSTTRALPTARRRGKLPRFAYWSHGWQMERGFKTPLDIAIQRYRLAFMRQADALATYTEEGAAWLRARLPRVPVVSLGNAIDLVPISAAAGAAAPARFGSPQLLAVGRLTRDKRLDAVIQIFRTVRKSHPAAALTIIGDGPDRQRLEAIAGPDLRAGVNFLGAIHSELELAPHFLGADFMVISGSAGLSVNHALGYGLPIVAYSRSANGPRHHPEIEYVVDAESGVLLPSFDDELMGARIAQAFERGEHTRLRRQIATKSPAPSVSDVADNFEKLFALLAPDSGDNLAR
jgi:glycosyltransferase involved in cell wall biosynthesis